MKKVFAIGRRRTGIKSITKALLMLGFKKTEILDKTKGKDVKSIISDMKSKNFCTCIFDYTMEDIRAIEAAYPDSVFILTERDIDKWYSSFIRFYTGKPAHSEKTEYKNKGQYTSQFYEGYNNLIKTHFQGREWKVLYFYYGQTASWQSLCQFLKKPIPTGSFPHENLSK